MSPTTGSTGSAQGGDLLGQFAQPVFAPGDDHHAGAVAGQFQRHRAADAARRAGDDRSAVRSDRVSCCSLAVLLAAVCSSASA